MAVLLGGLMMYGLQPGPMLFQQKPDFVWAVIASIYIGNVILLILNLPLVGMWARIAMIPFPSLGPLTLLFSVIGAYSIRGLLFDVWVALIFGVIGYYMRKTGFPVVPMVLASVLAQMLETSLQTALLISQGFLAGLLHQAHRGDLHDAGPGLDRPRALGAAARPAAGGGREGQRGQAPHRKNSSRILERRSRGRRILIVLFKILLAGSRHTPLADSLTPSRTPLALRGNRAEPRARCPMDRHGHSTHPGLCLRLLAG
jgi:hypothetical protein